MSTAGVPCLYAEIGKSGTGGAAYKRHGDMMRTTAAATSEHNENETKRATKSIKITGALGITIILGITALISQCFWFLPWLPSGDETWLETPSNLGR